MRTSFRKQQHLTTPQKQQWRYESIDRNRDQAAPEQKCQNVKKQKEVCGKRREKMRAFEMKWCLNTSIPSHIQATEGFDASGYRALDLNIINHSLMGPKQCTYSRKPSSHHDNNTLRLVILETQRSLLSSYSRESRKLASYSLISLSTQIRVAWSLFWPLESKQSYIRITDFLCSN